MDSQQSQEPVAVVERLLEATNRHDLDAIGACFELEFENVTPLHPARSFRGREQVRKNWAQILGAVPDIKAQIVGRAVAGDTIWAEWEMSGTRRDGVRHLLRGVMVFTVRAGHIHALRFYLEPVDDSRLGIDAAVAQVVGL